MANFIKRLLPDHTKAQLRRARKAVQKAITSSEVIIKDGVGAGLRFDTTRASGDYASGLNELPVQHVLRDLLKSGMVFYDIGANTGFFSVIGASLVGSSGTVYAFEAVEANAAMIEQNARLNAFEQVKVIAKAISNRSGEVSLILTEHPGGATLKSAIDAYGNTPSDALQSVSVPQVTIDALLERGEIAPPHVVKVDVEGAELAVLEGMTQTIEEHRPTIVFEIDAETQDAFDKKQGDCVAFLSRFHYTFTTLDDAYPGLSIIVRHTVASPQPSSPSSKTSTSTT